MVRTMLKELSKKGFNKIILVDGGYNSQLIILEINLDKDYNYENDSITAQYQEGVIVIYNDDIKDYNFNSNNELEIILN